MMDSKEQNQKMGLQMPSGDTSQTPSSGTSTSEFRGNPLTPERFDELHKAAKVLAAKNKDGKLQPNPNRKRVLLK